MYDSKLELLPGLYWKNPSFTKSEIRNAEEVIINTFRLHSAQFFANHHHHSDYEWLFLAQHFGASTRLLDWTVNLAVSAYFAILDYRAHTLKTQDIYHYTPKIFALNAEKYNEISNDIPCVIKPIDSKLAESWLLNCDQTNLDYPQRPIAFHPPLYDDRMRAQQSRFVLFGESRVSLEKQIAMLNTSDVIDSIEINPEKLEKISDSLHLLYVNNLSMFVSINDVAKFLQERYDVK